MRAISEAALRSVAAVNVILKKRRGRFREGEQAIVLNDLQNVLVMAAGLSRYFWPVRQQHEDRGLSLRIQFKVADDSPLRVRNVRNEIEHFDEKLDLYFSRPVVGVIIPQYVGPYRETDGVPGHYFRAYYTDRGIFEVLGNQFPMVPLVEEIARIDVLLRRSR